MSGQAAMLMMIGAMHLLGLLCAAALLIPALRSPDARDQGEDGSSGGGGSGVQPPRHPDAPRGGLPLPDAIPARVRLRDHRRLAELLPRPSRRRTREPERSPQRVG